jgi:serine/threonine protein kinase/Tol biopolymer transport system component
MRDRWRQIDELLDAVMELPAEEREAFLTKACAGDDELRREVRSLLAGQEKVSGFLEGPAMQVVAQAMARSPEGPSAPFSGREVGSYMLERLLGEGGMGQVYLAHDRKLNRKIALKILPGEFSADPERVRRFMREARAISAFNHPNIVTIHDVGESGGSRYIATELVEGRTLDVLVREGLTLKEALTIGAQVAEALAAAHGAGVIHRDIKPENIMVRADGYVKVLDFGLAKLIEVAERPLDDAATETRAGVVMGTLPYMSPEQAAGESCDHRTDLWSLGVVLYQMVTGKSPFMRETRQSTLNAILSITPESVGASRPERPDDLDRVVGKALEKDRALRYQSASELHADLRHLLREIENPSARLSKTVVAPRPRRSRRPMLFVAVGLGALLVSGFAARGLFRGRPDAPDWSRATHIQLTDQLGTEFYPRLAPDGKTFVYASGGDGNLDIFLQRVGGKDPSNLTKDSAGDDTEPAFSPDGERIAFRSSREAGGIYVMDATGKDVRRVADGGFHPSWSPDGEEIVFSEAGMDLPSVRVSSALWIVNVATGVKRLLTEIDAMHPAWSPSGKRVAFWFLPPSIGRRDVATISRDGGEPVVITKDATTNWNPVWSPDGRHLYFVSDRSGNMSFWRVAINEDTGEALSEPEAIVTPSKFSQHLAFSRDGEQMIYVQTEKRSNIQAVELDTGAERIVGEPFWITRGDREVTNPRLSSDGEHFVVRLSRRTQDDIVVVNRDGTSFRDLTNDKYFDRYPRWSPDGERVAFASDRSGVYEIWMINVDGTNLRQVTHDSPGATAFPVWSPDGGQLALERDGVTMIVDPNKSWAEQAPQPLPPLDNPADHFSPWDWSPDGKKLSGSFGGNLPQGFGYYSFETRRYEVMGNFFAAPMWLSDSRRFVFAHGKGAFIADTETKETRELFTSSWELIRAAAVSQDNRLLYFTAHSTESDIWLLDLSSKPSE